MKDVAFVSLTGDFDGDYIVLVRYANGQMKLAPKPRDGLPAVIELKQTCTACPSQWEGDLDDGRKLYARYRWGELSVGVGAGIDQAVDNSMSPDALYAEHVGDGLDGYMDTDELRRRLYGLASFPEETD